MLITYVKPLEPPRGRPSGRNSLGPILARGPVFVARALYTERKPLSDAGFQWSGGLKIEEDTQRGHWWTAEPAIAAKLAAYCDELAGPHVAKLIASKKASQSLDAEVDWPRPPGQEYLPFQRAGIRYMRTRPNTLCADEMGLGKTIQAIGFLNSLPEDQVQRVLITCPASIKRNWARELQRWLVHRLNVGIASAKHIPGFANIVIINPESLHRHSKYMESVEWDVLIGDEAHLFKSTVAARSKAFYAIKAKRKLYLTGTPIVNRPAEIFPLISSLDPQRWNSEWQFKQRYCSWSDRNGGQNLEELQDILRSTIMIRRLKAEVLVDLPPKWRQIVELPTTKETAAIIEEEMAKFKEAAREKGVVMDAGATDREWIEAVMSLGGGMWAGFADLSRLRHATAVAKIPQVVDHLKELLEETPKIVVWAHHTDVLDGLQAGLSSYGCVRLDGTTPQDKRQGVVDRFQTDDGIRLFLGGITAAGVGITLTAANTAVFAELDWTPGNMKQAEDRCHRIGAEGHESIMIQHMVLEGSMDVGMAELLVEKLETMEKLLNREAMESKKRERVQEQQAELPIGALANQPIAAPPMVRTFDDRLYRQAGLPAGKKQADAVRLACRMLLESSEQKWASPFHKDMAEAIARWKGDLIPRQAKATSRMLDGYSWALTRELYRLACYGRD